MDLLEIWKAMFRYNSLCVTQSQMHEKAGRVYVEAAATKRAEVVYKATSGDLGSSARMAFRKCVPASGSFGAARLGWWPEFRPAWPPGPSCCWAENNNSNREPHAFEAWIIGFDLLLRGPWTGT